MSYTDQYAVAANTSFIDRVVMAICEIAIVTNGEADTVEHAAERAQLALYVLRDPQVWARLFAFGIAADPTIDLGATDGAIFSRASFIWTKYALAHTTEQP